MLIVEWKLLTHEKKGEKIMTKRFGFTLAEVLITLGIIGVVAAMTIPTLIANTNGATLTLPQLLQKIRIQLCHSVLF